jgi:alginate O-acetyltransferase complex protein AlgI
MSFASVEFPIFIAFFFILWPIFRTKVSIKLIYLVLASLVFYGWTDIRNIIYLAVIGVFTFLWGWLILHSKRNRNVFLVVGIAVILGTLIVYRYPELFVNSLDLFRGHDGQMTEWQLRLNRFFPLGISFITLHCISFLADCKSEKVQELPGFIPFAAYLAFFPKLIAGPIQQYDDIVPQLVKNEPMGDDALWSGFKLIVFGYFYKTVVGDHLATFVANAFGSNAVLQNSLYWWLIITTFALQIYFDFRGYTNIARGLASWMGVSLKENFDHPYASNSVGDFWNRWHMSFSAWLRNYVFFPIARSKLFFGNPYVAVWITMIVSGLWHGAGWTFLAWGLAMAIYISIERATNWPKRLGSKPFGIVLSKAITVLQIWIAWVFFRARDLAQGLEILKVQFGLSQQATFSLPYQFWAFLLLAIGLEILQLTRWLDHIIIAPKWSKRAEAVFLVLVLATSVLFRGAENEFVYFQF